MEPKQETAREQFCSELCALGNLMWRRLGEHTRQKGLGDVTVMHAMVIGYLSDHETAYQRDLETVFQVNRSTITKIVQVMERRGYIRRDAVPQDKRLKKISLTDKGREICAQLKVCIKETDQDFISALPPDESQVFMASMRKLRKKME